MNAANEQAVTSAATVSWSYALEAHPSNRKCLLLTRDGIAVIGSETDLTGYIAWAPLPDRDKAKEKELGL
jgi:hypothetical protein